MVSIELRQDPERPVPHPYDPKSDTDGSDPYIVVFSEPYDGDNPIQWPERRKWVVTNILSATGFNRIVVSTIMAPALPVVAADLSMTPTQTALSLSIYLLATAFGPIVIGPLSEMYGRQAVLHTSNIWFAAWNLACGFATTKEVLIVSRLFTGLGASAIYSLGGGVLGDVWPPEQRGKSLGTYLAIPLIAVAIGPILGGIITAHAHWRWMFWATSIFQGVSIIVCFFTFRETSGAVILKRRAARLRRTTGNMQYKTLNERLDRDLPLVTVLKRALARPLRLLAFHPVIQLTSIISAVNYGLLYVVLSSFADALMSQYNLSIELAGLHYIAIALGEIAGSQLGGCLMDVLYRRTTRKQGSHEPEARLPLVYPGVALAYLGLVVLGWAAKYRIHWIIVDIGAFVFAFGGQISGMPVQAYVIDVYVECTSSALSATQFGRSLAAFLFPLFAPALYRSLGYGWGNSTIAFVGAVAGVVPPFLLWKYGARLRAKTPAV
ncbi:MFS general substrate transporter [Coniochaeta hoffmannii]|uniref:MFS general substrate transporter n=1 Tax=Coniochaeta hoffmannii TaxID=91930 RepID=A0AA38RLV2_9PEZI|nr:MFS general substrate transporter [Coniochaeta hoffmannii]